METQQEGTMWTGGIINKKKPKKGTLINSSHVQMKDKTNWSVIIIPVDSNHEDILGFLSLANTAAVESSEN